MFVATYSFVRFNDRHGKILLYIKFFHAFINREIMKIGFEYESQEEARVTLEAILVNVNLNFHLKSQKRTIRNVWKNVKYRRIFP